MRPATSTAVRVRRFSVRVLRQRRHRPLGPEGPSGALVRIPLADLDETFIGTRLLVIAHAPGSGPVVLCGGVSDLFACDLRTGRRWVLLWINGSRVRLYPGSVVVAEPPPTAF